MKTAPPVPVPIAQQLAAMKVGDYKLFDQNPAHSVRAQLSRLVRTNKNYSMRQYVTRLAKGTDHAEVWRIEDKPSP